MIGVIANIKIMENKKQEFEKIATLLVNAVNENEPENIYYKLYKKSKNLYIFLEGYKTRDALDYHTKTDHYKKYGKIMSQYLDGKPEVIIMDQIAPK